MKKISLKYEGRCLKCGGTIPTGQVAYWERDKGVWHLDCALPSRHGLTSSSRSFWGILTAIFILAFVLGGFVLGPFVMPKGPVFPATITITVTQAFQTTATATETVGQPTSLTTGVKQKWISPSDPNVISWQDAAKYVGKTKTVEGVIVRTHKSSSNTIFLNFHDPYQGYFYAVIFASDLGRFPFKPEDFYRGKEVRVTGLIKLYQGSPEIVVESPSQIEVANLGFSYP